MPACMPMHSVETPCSRFKTGTSINPTCTTILESSCIHRRRFNEYREILSSYLSPCYYILNYAHPERHNFSSNFYIHSHTCLRRRVSHFSTIQKTEKKKTNLKNNENRKIRFFFSIFLRFERNDFFFNYYFHLVDYFFIFFLFNSPKKKQIWKIMKIEKFDFLNLQRFGRNDFFFQLLFSFCWFFLHAIKWAGRLRHWIFYSCCFFFVLER